MLNNGVARERSHVRTDVNDRVELSLSQTDLRRVVVIAVFAKMLVIDGDKLSENYKIGPYNDFAFSKQSNDSFFVAKNTVLQ